MSPHERQPDMGQPTVAPAFFTYRTPFGQITVQSNGQAVTKLMLGRQRLSGTESPDSVTNACATQVNEYLAGRRSAFSVPICPSGSQFQKAVWAAIENIPYGQTRTASEIASVIGSAGASQAVGRAANENPIPIIIPAHRVIPSSGRVNPNDADALLRQRFRELEARFA